MAPHPGDETFNEIGQPRFDMKLEPQAPDKETLLANLMKDRTTFVIAHRLSTVRRADLIIALERGQVAEIGTHEELVSKPGGVYARLYALQAFDERDADRTGDVAETLMGTESELEGKST